MGQHCNHYQQDEAEPCWGPVRTNAEGTWLCEGHERGRYVLPRHLRPPPPEPTPEERAAAEQRRLERLPDSQRYGFWKPSEHLDEWVDQRVRLTKPYGSIPVGAVGVVDDWKGGWPTITWDPKGEWGGGWISAPLSHLERVGEAR
jgi:hypothetical protein